MTEKIGKLPKNWFKKISRHKHRGREYYYNANTNEKSWSRPKKLSRKRNVVEWLNRIETEMVSDTVVPVQIPNETECNNLLKLEMEYKKFEQFLADIEIDEAMDSKTLEMENGSSSLDLWDGYQCIHTSNMNQLSSMNANYRAPFISIDDEKAMQKVSRIRHHEELMHQELYGNGYIYHEPACQPFFIVVDTIMFMTQMQFLVNLMAKIDSVPGKPMLVVPYAVLQDLDKLKMSTENEASVLAMYAIAFISEQLKMVPNKICSQSAMDNGYKYIEIESANDSIINCCFQFKQHFGNVVLLTNDMSLSNKSICSHIDTFSKYEFEAIFL